MRIQNSRSQVGIRHIAKVLLIRGFFILFPISIHRAVFFCRFLASVKARPLRIELQCKNLKINHYN